MIFLWMILVGIAFLILGGVSFSGLVVIILKQVHFCQKAKAVTARLVSYDMHSKFISASGHPPPDTQVHAVVTFTDDSGNIRMAVAKDYWRGKLRSPGSQVTAYYQPNNYAWVQTHLPSRCELIGWAALALFVPGLLVLTGALLLAFAV